MRSETTPSGGSACVSGRPLPAFCMNAIQIGSAATAPVSFDPSERGWS